MALLPTTKREKRAWCVGSAYSIPKPHSNLSQHLCTRTQIGHSHLRFVDPVGWGETNHSSGPPLPSSSRGTLQLVLGCDCEAGCRVAGQISPHLWRRFSVSKRIQNSSAAFLFTFHRDVTTTLLCWYLVRWIWAQKFANLDIRSLGADPVWTSDLRVDLACANKDSQPDCCVRACVCVGRRTVSLRKSTQVLDDKPKCGLRLRWGGERPYPVRRAKAQATFTTES